MTVQKNVDIGKVIEKKSPRLFKLIPKFLLRKIKSLLHESEINNILENLSGKEKLDFTYIQDLVYLHLMQTR